VGELWSYKFHDASACTALSVATANIEASTYGYDGKAAVDFDKVGDATERYAGAYVTLTGSKVGRCEKAGASDYASLVIYPPAGTSPVLCLALGESLTNFLEWRWTFRSYTSDQWNFLTARLGGGTPKSYVGGTWGGSLGCNPGNIRFIAVYGYWTSGAATQADVKIARVSIIRAADF